MSKTRKNRKFQLNIVPKILDLLGWGSDQSRSIKIEEKLGNCLSSLENHLSNCFRKPKLSKEVYLGLLKISQMEGFAVIDSGYKAFHLIYLLES